MEGDPHALIEGMAIAGRAVNAAHGYIYIRAEYPSAIHRMATAIGQARDRGYLGHDVLGAGFSFDLEIRTGAGAYICGEETALIESLEGKRGTVRPKPPFRRSAACSDSPPWSTTSPPSPRSRPSSKTAARGTRPAEPGAAGAPSPSSSRGGFAPRGLWRSPLARHWERSSGPLAGACPKAAGFKAVQVGGPLGAIFPGTGWTPPWIRCLRGRRGASRHGGVVVFDHTANMAALSHHFARFFAHESCGVCTPCRIGTTRAEEILDRVVAGGRTRRNCGSWRSWPTPCALRASAPSDSWPPTPSPAP